ncbi:hypothetical protein NLG97_g32 [Lecanicillium saksenae]|uniref:Uncharacterized protein n=1 Tax=Lecanicillium saksenae TaxID=468837 RepID=A0ACC1RAE6_9HYPO|nr:hypothetical protein NLG97_g32 [Lecanicillium saksenae]
MCIPGCSTSALTTSNRGNTALACEPGDAPLYNGHGHLALDESLGFFCTSSLPQASAPMVLEPSVDGPNLTQHAAAFFSSTDSSPSQLPQFPVSTKAPFHPMPMPCPSAATKSVSIRMTELRLWHYFSSSAYQNAIFGSGSTTSALWLYDIPNLAISSESYLLDAILSVAAAHMQLHSPNDTGIATACRVYADSALRQYKNASFDGSLTGENAESYFFAAGLVTISTMAARASEKVDKKSNSTGSDESSHHISNGNYSAGASGEYTLPLNWFRRFQDVQSIVSQSWNNIFNSITAKKILQGTAEFKLIPSFTTTISGGSTNLPLSFFGHLLRDMGDECQPNSKSNQAYEHAVTILNWIHSHPLPLAVIVFPATISEHFLDLVIEKRPRALVILACFFALMKRAEPIWWLSNGTVRDEVMGIVNLFEPGSEWWRHLEWPIRIALQGDGTPISPAIWGSEYCGRRQMGENLVETLGCYFEALVSVLTVQSSIAF